MPENFVLKSKQEPHVLLVLDDQTEYGRYLRRMFHKFSATQDLVRSSHSNRRYAIRTLLHCLSVENKELLHEYEMLPAELSAWRYETAALENLWAVYNNLELPTIVVRLRHPDSLNLFLNLFSLIGVYNTLQVGLNEETIVRNKAELTSAAISFMKAVNALPSITTD